MDAQEPLRSYRSRSGSPSPTASPTAALSLCPALDRSFSTASSMTSSSDVSSSGLQSDAAPGRKRGYIRPQATVFADSARNRDSVMSLGTIAHLQHYFARTGLLDGKGAQLAKETRKDGPILSPTTLSFASPPSLVTDESSYAPSQLDINDEEEELPICGSPEQIKVVGTGEEPDVLNLSPTRSTYKHKVIYVPPPPNLNVLRRELREALEDARKLLNELQEDERAVTNTPAIDRTVSESPTTPQGYHEIQGLRVLDMVTLAIRAARNYYTSHERPQRLYSIRSERQIRSELYAVLEVLKKLASRQFAGGLKKAEQEHILDWTASIEHLVSQEEQAENEEHERRQQWGWREGIWAGRERQREWLFLKSFDTDAEPLPDWTEPPDNEVGASPFLLSLSNGLKLVKLHNELVKSSRRQFEEIKVFHTDTAKPYRCADNLRYWVKAAELRWDTLLDLDVNAVVHGTSKAAWHGFDAAIMKWCKAVREEVTQEWTEYREAQRIERPIVRMSSAEEVAW